MFRAPFLVTDPGSGGTITVDRWGSVVPVVTAGAEARTLAAPTKAGLVVTVVLDTRVGDLTLTVNPASGTVYGYNADNATTIVFGSAGDYVTFMSIKAGSEYAWRVVSHEGTNVAGEDMTVDQLTATTATLTTAGVTTATVTTLNAPTVSAEHGAGVIGTAAAPVTSRRTVNGDIITEFKIDLTGLTSKDTANDAIGLAAGGNAYIGRNVVATNGIIYKMEMICVEIPAGGDDDINVVANASGTIAYDGAGGTTYGINGGDWTAGKVVENLVQGLTANDYFYLTAGTGDTAAAYTGGMFIIRWYGHALLA
jgi:hypothetical protein